MLQHIATYRNRVTKRTQHVVPNNVARCCVEMLRAFGQALRVLWLCTRSTCWLHGGGVRLLLFSHYHYHHFLPGKQARFSPFFLSLFIIIFNVIVVFFALFTAFSITCYRCGGAEPTCESSSLETVECADSSIPNAVFACQIYSVNYTTLKGQVLQFKGRGKNDKSLNSTKRGQNVHHSSIRHFRVSRV